MKLDEIIAIGGKPGLFKLLTQTKSGFVAESLTDGKRLTVNLRNQVSVLSEISVFTLEEEKPLTEVFELLRQKENGNTSSISHKADKLTLEEYFFEVLPNYDEDRVYPSDIKKIIRWYNILVDHKLLEISEDTEQDNEEE
ncbi:MAG: hypothetical protein CMC19_02165 [Flavobacteriaceae bacterium]|nr:hypothetical protein [Flavobacteriaceae bacterium]OUX40208.1 MAG: hypothetical protein CBE25_00990 [Flavobacteriaceae bacterium TMED265]